MGNHVMLKNMKQIANIGVLLSVWLLGACSPTVKIETPDKPITINMNVNVQQEVHVKVAKDLSQAISQNPNLF